MLTKTKFQPKLLNFCLKDDVLLFLSITDQFLSKSK